MFAVLESEKISWTLEAKAHTVSLHTTECLCATQDGKSGEGRIFVLAFKFDVSQVFRKIVKSYFEPLVELFGKFSDNLSQTVWVREMKKNNNNLIRQNSQADM